MQGGDHLHGLHGQEDLTLSHNLPFLHPYLGNDPGKGSPECRWIEVGPDRVCTAAHLNMALHHVIGPEDGEYLLPGREQIAAGGLHFLEAYGCRRPTQGDVIMILTDLPHVYLVHPVLVSYPGK